MPMQPRPLCATGTRCWCMMAEPAAKKARRGNSFFLRKNVNLRRIDRSIAARETTVPLTCVCISQRCMSQEALDTLLDEKGKQDVYSSSEHLGYSLVLIASLSYIYYSCIPLPHSCSCIYSSGDKIKKQTLKKTSKQTINKQKKNTFIAAMHRKGTHVLGFLSRLRKN